MANQFRLLLASAAYVLIEHLRRVGLKGTEWAKAQVGTIRLMLSHGGRKFIAYRPSSPHFFTADKSADALVYVISYCRASEQDPTDDILKAASESEPLSTFRLQKKRRRTKTEQR